MLDKAENVNRLRKLLPRGAQSIIARKLGITQGAVSQQISSLRPSSPAVQEAMRIITESGSQETEQKLRELLNNSETTPG